MNYSQLKVLQDSSLAYRALLQKRLFDHKILLQKHSLAFEQTRDDRTEQWNLRQAQTKFIEGLRDEAYKVRDCFTRYSLQALGLISVALAGVAGLMKSDVTFGLLAFFVVLVIFAIFYLGLHKFGTSNRLLGYELHLQRIQHYDSSHPFKPHMAEIGWEEAMRAYRIVQPSLFEIIYQTSQARKFTRLFRPTKVRPEVAQRIDDLKDNPASKVTGRWFEPRTQLPDNIIYRAGGYLTMMLGYLSLCLIPAAVMVVIASCKLAIELGLWGLDLSHNLANLAFKPFDADPCCRACCLAGSSFSIPMVTRKHFGEWAPFNSFNGLDVGGCGSCSLPSIERAGDRPKRRGTLKRGAYHTAIATGLYGPAWCSG